MSAPRILIVDDEADLRELLEITVLKMGLDSDCAANLAEARACLSRKDYALVITDMRLPDGTGIELVRELANGRRQIPVSVITAFGSADNAVAALKAGAFDYLSKPVALDQLRLMVQSALRIGSGPSTERGRGDDADNGSSRLIGKSGAMQDLRAQISRLARSMAPIAITGESGSGKELAARDIHAHSSRRDKPFVAVNCGAIPENLMEAEFFGYRKGAFTGANDDRDGFFQAANGGTLMLDEVADLPLPMQVKLLRAIQERRVRKLGATAEEPVDVRLISATHQNLAECVDKGRFRQDLFYRLNVIELRLPPLRERLEDVEELSDFILARLSPSDAVSLEPAALAALSRYHFPGNVRELENILERALAFSSKGVISVADLALKLTPSATSMKNEEVVEAAKDEVALPPSASAEFAEAEDVPLPQAMPTAGSDELPSSLPDHLEAVERDIIRRALERTRFNRTQAAELLGMSFRQLRYRMQRLGIREPD
jgi:two-component system response regulator PilR (NtrC family)